MKLQLVEGRQIDVHTYIHSLQVAITTLNEDHEGIRILRSLLNLTWSSVLFHRQGEESALSRSGTWGSSHSQSKYVVWKSKLLFYSILVFMIITTKITVQLAKKCLFSANHIIRYFSGCVQRFRRRSGWRPGDFSNGRRIQKERRNYSRLVTTVFFLCNEVPVGKKLRRFAFVASRREGILDRSHPLCGLKYQLLYFFLKFYCVSTPYMGWVCCWLPYLLQEVLLLAKLFKAGLR